MKRLFLALLLLVFTVLGGCVTISPSDQDARAAAVDWLALLDAGKYQQAYDERPPRLKSDVFKPNFLATMQSRRAPLGKAKSRAFLRVSYSKTLIGAPDGSYGFIYFKSSFEHKAHGIEKVIVTGETGHWQVSGYNIY